MCNGFSFKEMDFVSITSLESLTFDKLLSSLSDELLKNSSFSRNACSFQSSTILLFSSLGIGLRILGIEFVFVGYGGGGGSFVEFGTLDVEEAPVAPQPVVEQAPRENNRTRRERAPRARREPRIEVAVDGDAPAEDGLLATLSRGSDKPVPATTDE